MCVVAGLTVLLYGVCWFEHPVGGCSPARGAHGATHCDDDDRLAGSSIVREREQCGSLPQRRRGGVEAVLCCGEVRGLVMFRERNTAALDEV